MVAQLGKFAKTDHCMVCLKGVNYIIRKICLKEVIFKKATGQFVVKRMLNEEFLSRPCNHLAVQPLPPRAGAVCKMRKVGKGTPKAFQLQNSVSLTFTCHETVTAASFSPGLHPVSFRCQVFVCYI